MFSAYESISVVHPQRLTRPKLVPMDVVTTVLLCTSMYSVQRTSCLTSFTPYISPIQNTHSYFTDEETEAQRLNGFVQSHTDEERLKHRSSDSLSFLRKISHSTDIHWAPTLRLALWWVAERKRPRLCPSCLKLRMLEGMGHIWATGTVEVTASLSSVHKALCRKNCGHQKLWVNPSQWEWRGVFGVN